MQYKRGCAVQARMCSTSNDVQCEAGTYSLQMRMCSTNEARHQYECGCNTRKAHNQALEKGKTIQKYF